MCDPLTIAGIALTAGSTVANGMAQRAVQRARDDAMAAERIRQRGYDQEAQALNTKSQDRYQDFEGQQQQEGAKLTDYFGAQAAPPPAPETLPASSSNITVREDAKRLGEAGAYGDQQDSALGNLRSFGDLLGGISRLQARDASQVGQIGGFKRGSSGVLPFELDAASEKGAGARLLGDILGGLGSVGVSAGLGGGSLPFLGGAAPKAISAIPLVGAVAAKSPLASAFNPFGG